MDLCYDDMLENKNDNARHMKRMENGRVYMFLAGLNRNLDEMWSQILNRKPLSSLGEMIFDVKERRGRRKVMMGDNNQSLIEASTLATKATNSYHQSNTRQPRKWEKLWCDHCHKPRHTWETCWEIHGKPQNWKPMAFNHDSKAFYVRTKEQENLNGSGRTTNTPHFNKK